MTNVEKVLWDAKRKICEKSFGLKMFGNTREIW